jgi:hypothetical protein
VTKKKATGKRDARPKPAAKAPKARSAARPAKPAPRATAPARPAAASPSALEQARSLRDAIERSKQTSPDPWGYTAKARGWLQRTDQVLVRIASGADAAGSRKTLETLQAEVEADRDFREARRLF